MKIYGISGLGADKRAFQYLTLDHDFEVLDWIPPLEQESLANYAIRLFSPVKKDETYGVLGLSFGGMIATEISKHYDPEITILLSSAETRSDLPLILRQASKFNFHQYLPNKKPFIPRFMIQHMFGTSNKQLLNEILKDSDPMFTKWAVGAMMSWDNELRIENSIKISGTKDKILPPTDRENTILIEGGKHFMVVDKAKEISRTINEKTAIYTNNTHIYELDKNN